MIKFMLLGATTLGALYFLVLRKHSIKMDVELENGEKPVEVSATV